MPRSKQIAHAQLDQLRSKAADERIKQRDSRERTVTKPVAMLRNEERHTSFDPLVGGSSYRMGLSSLSCFAAATGSGSLSTENGGRDASHHTSDLHTPAYLIASVAELGRF